MKEFRFNLRVHDAVRSAGSVCSGRLRCGLQKQSKSAGVRMRSGSGARSGSRSGRFLAMTPP